MKSCGNCSEGVQSRTQPSMVQCIRDQNLRHKTSNCPNWKKGYVYSYQENDFLKQNNDEED